MTGRGRGNWEIKHGGCRRSGRTPEYGVWAKMRRRCSNPACEDWENYGGRGIDVCPQWEDFATFLSDMGPRPSPQHTIERVNNERGYSPDNCVWATRAVQNKNRRPRQPKSECARGHPLSGDNLYLRPDGKRGCKACRRKNMRDFYEART